MKLDIIVVKIQYLIKIVFFTEKEARFLTWHDLKMKKISKWRKSQNEENLKENRRKFKRKKEENLKEKRRKKKCKVNNKVKQ